MNPPNTLRHAALTLGLFSFFCLGLVTCVHQVTQTRIAQNQTLRLLQNLQSLAPEHDNELLDDCIDLAGPAIGTLKDARIYRARKARQPLTAIFSATTSEGYSGDIKLLVAVQADGSLVGVRVLSHQETPGLGDLIDPDKSAWILKFDHRSLQNTMLESWKVKRDGGSFDQFTGATVTPRAIVKLVRDVLIYFDSNREAVFANR